MEIYESEFEILQSIVNLAGELAEVTKIDAYNKGFILEGGHITHLGLAKMGMEELPENIGNLQHSHVRRIEFKLY